MASGGQNPSPNRRNPSMHSKQSSSSSAASPARASSGSGFEKTPWFLPPNNLDINRKQETKPPSTQKSGEKQRIRDRLRDHYLAENSLSVSPSSSPRWNPFQQAAEFPFFDSAQSIPPLYLSQQQMPGVPRNSVSHDMMEKGKVAENGAASARSMDAFPNASSSSSSLPSNSRQEFHSSPHDLMPSAAQCKQDNTSKSLDTSVIVERLIRLRDCIKQVTTVKQNLEKSDESQKTKEQLLRLSGILKDLREKEMMLESLYAEITREQMARLEDMLDELRQEEHDQLEILQQTLSLREEMSSSALAPAGDVLPSAVIEARQSEDKDQLEDKSEALLKRRNELLKKVIESREKLAALEQQQALLLAMQKRAESQLSEARALQVTDSLGDAEHLLSENEPAQNQKSNPASAFPGTHYSVPSERSDDSHRISDSAYSEDPDWDADQTPSATSKSSLSKADENAEREQKQNISSLTSQLLRMQKKLRILDQLGHVTEAAEVLVTEDMPVRPEEAASEQSLMMVDRHRQKLENKLQELNEKKQHMDRILQQLSTLQDSARPTRIPPEPPARQSSFLNENAQETIKHTQQFLDSIDTSEKMRSLNEMRDTIRQLHAFIDNYQPTSIRAVQEAAPTSQEIPTENRIAPPVRRKGKVQGSAIQNPQMPKTNVLVKQENSMVDLANGFPARRHYEAEGRANEDGDAAAASNQPSGAVAMPSSSSAASYQQGNWGQKAADQGLRKDEVARKAERLQKLEAMLSTIQQLQASGKQVPKQFMDMIESVANDVEQRDRSASPESSDRESARPSANNEEDEEDEDEDQERKEDQKQLSKLREVEQKMHQQQEELQHLLDERLQLLNIRDALQSLQTRIKNNDVRAAGEGSQPQKSMTDTSSRSRTSQLADELGALTADFSFAKTAKTGIKTTPKQENTRTTSFSNNLPSFASSKGCGAVPGPSVPHPPPRVAVEAPSATAGSRTKDLPQPDRNLSLRQEMQTHMDVLKELLQQEKSKRLSYSQNEDVQSFSGSSVKSEPLEDSVLAPDTTVAATWGGSSTQDNFEDEVEEAIETAEECDDNESGSEGRAGRALGVDPATFSSLLHTFGVDQQRSRLGRKKDTTKTKSQPLQQHQQQQQNQQHSRGSSQHGSASNERACSWSSGKNVKKGATSVKIQPHQQDEMPMPADPPAPADQAATASAQPGPESSADFAASWQQFMNQMSQQIESTSSMFHSVVQDQQALTRIAQNPRMVTPDMLQQFTRQLQQQLLLLHLGQCYQIMYLQQLEIMQLQQCLPQFGGKGGSSPTLLMGSQPHAPAHPQEDFVFRPWFNVQIPNLPQAHGGQGNHANASQVPPATSTTPPLFTSPMAQNSTPPPPPPPNTQDGRGATETLNNQVPPGTRANNFWDNFRSYSRQNLLSAAAVSSKSNEYPSSTGQSNTPPMRQTGDMPQGTSPGSRNMMRTWEWVYPRGDNMQAGGSGSGTHIKSRYQERPVPNPERQELLSMQKRKNPNLNQEQQNSASGFLNLPSSSLMNTSAFVPGSALAAGTDATTTSAANIFACPRSANNNTNAATISPGTVWNQHQMGIGKRMRDSDLLNANEAGPQNSGESKGQTPFLFELLRQLQLLKSDSQRENLLMTLQEMVSQGSAEEANQPPRTTNVSHGPTQDYLSSLGDLQETSSAQEPTQPHDNDLASFNTSEARVQGSEASHSTPLSSQQNKGAIRKKQYPKSVPSSRLETQPIADEVTNDQAFAIPPRFYYEGSGDPHAPLELVVEQAVMELAPLLQSHREEECSAHLQAQLCSQIMGCLPSLPQQQLPALYFFRSKMLQALQQALAKYSGRRVCDCEAELLMDITEVTLKHLSMQKHLVNARESTEDSPTLTPIKMSNDEPGLSRADMTGPESDEMNPQPFIYASENHFSGATGSSSNQRDLRPHAVSAEGTKGSGDLVLEDDAGYECDVEGETEPEVEAETEADDTKDLAEADQTPKQSANEASTSEMLLAGARSDEHAADAERELYLPNGDIDGPEQEGACGESPPQQDMPYRAEGGRPEETTLDDIPTKLPSCASQDEAQKDIAEGQMMVLEPGAAVVQLNDESSVLVATGAPAFCAHEADRGSH